jgi:hypothetical protein
MSAYAVCDLIPVESSQDEVDVEVPRAHLTTKGVSPRRDVD